MQPMAIVGHARSSVNTNLSRSLALSMLDTSGRDLAITADRDHPIELIIPRDPNLVMPPMALQNVTSTNASPHRRIFNLHFSNITSALPVSVHFEMQPLDVTRGYLFVYRFDSAPQLNSSVRLMDGWTLFCPSSEFSHRLISTHLSRYRCAHLLHRQSANSRSSIRDLWPARAECVRDSWCVLFFFVCPKPADDGSAAELLVELRAARVHVRMLLSRWQQRVAVRWPHRNAPGERIRAITLLSS